MEFDDSGEESEDGMLIMEDELMFSRQEKVLEAKMPTKMKATTKGKTSINKTNMIISGRCQKLKRPRFGEPMFYNKYFCIKPVNAGNTLTIVVEDFLSIKGFDQCFLCLYHGCVADMPKCTNCYPFLKFPHTFLLKSFFELYSIPPPAIFSDKNVNFFKSFLETCKKRFFEQIPKRKSNKPKQRKLNLNGQKIHENIKYLNFIRSDFKGGNLGNMRSGKKSYVRNKILGKCVNGARMTLTIDSAMSPNEISIPQVIFDSLKLACPLVVVNRSPSINSKCIYVAEVKPHSNDNYTILINSYILEGLHADQDGDELNIYFLKHDATLPSHMMKVAIAELKMLSWQFGLRYDFFYKPRYEFSQYQKTLCSIYDEELKRTNHLWASLGDAPIKKKLNMIMNLGCSIKYDEVDEFIGFLCNIIKKNKIHPDSALMDWHNDHIVTINDSVFETDFLLKHIIEAGAKGSKMHINTFKNALFNSNIDAWQKSAIEKFDHTVNSSSEMSIAGAQQFVLLYEFNSLFLNGGDLYKNGNKILDGFLDCDLGNVLSYNMVAVDWTFDQIDQL